MFLSLSLSLSLSLFVLLLSSARNGQLRVLQWLQNAPGPEKGRKPVLEQECAEFAAQAGHVEVLEWLRSQDPPCPWSGFTAMKAAVHGHLDCLKCLRKHGCPFDRVAVMAASQGHTKVLQWLTGEGLLSMDPMICTGALTSGNLECCEYLRQSGFTFSSLAISAAGKCSPFQHPPLCARALVLTPVFTPPPASTSLYHFLSSAMWEYPLFAVAEGHESAGA